MRVTFVSAMLVAAALAGGCTQDRKPLPVAALALNEPYRLDAGDRVRVIVYNEASITNVYEVSQAGMISLPLVGLLPARGATAGEMQARIAARLAQSFIRDPDVAVEVAQHRPYFVLGEVGTAGQYAYTPGMNAETAIAKAGGFSPRANRRVVRVSRAINGKLYEGNIAVTEPIRPGDTIYVAERLF